MNGRHNARYVRTGAAAVLLAGLLAGCAVQLPAQPVTAGADPAPVTVAAASPAATATPAAPETSAAADDDGARPAGWTAASHSNDADPDFAVVFPQDKVNEITITIDPESWAAMQADMTELFGEAGTGGPGRGGPGGLPPGGDFQPPAAGEFPPPGAQPGGAEPPAGMAPGGPGGPGGFSDFTPENPMWVPATIEFEGQTWNHVGIRYKGNSSLLSGWNSGSLKLPFKLDFDEFEDGYPEIDNQRFFGFKQLSLANGFSDDTFMRDAIAYDLLEEAGLVAAETAFYKVNLDYGEGPVALGLYTMVEVVDDTVVNRYFGDDDGNIYEGDGRGATLAEGTSDLIADSFQKENNEDEADWSDIEALYTTLHAATRLSDPAAWRAELESVFDVDAFLEWLAISAVIGHWDSYGQGAHNFYLYNDPATGQLTWISWDHNMTMSTGMGGDMGGKPNGGAPDDAGAAPARPGPGGMSRGVSLDKADVSADWPLIRYLLDDPTYHAAYVDYVETAGTELFDPARMAAKIDELTALLAPYAADDVGEASFDTAVQRLRDFVNTRAAAVNTFLAAAGQE